MLDARPSRDPLEKRITTTAYLTGAAAAFWLIPVTMLFFRSHLRIFILATALAVCMSMCTVLVGFVYRGQRAHLARRDADAELAQSLHADLVKQVVEDRLAAERANRAVVVLLDDISAKVARAYWHVYSDALVDIQGGPEVVEGATTRPLHERQHNDRPERAGGVVPIRGRSGLNTTTGRS